jgi:hypothetical protein
MLLLSVVGLLISSACDREGYKQAVQQKCGGLKEECAKEMENVLPSTRHAKLCDPDQQCTSFVSCVESLLTEHKCEMTNMSSGIHSWRKGCELAKTVSDVCLQKLASCNTSTISPTKAPSQAAKSFLWTECSQHSNTHPAKQQPPSFPYVGKRLLSSGSFA